MKKFFSIDSRFNIFSLVGLIIIISNFFILESSLILIGLLISQIPDTSRSIVHYKNTGQINFTLVSNSIVLVFLVIILASKIFKF